MIVEVVGQKSRLRRLRLRVRVPGRSGPRGLITRHCGLHCRISRKSEIRLQTLLTALQNVVPSHLMDHQLHDFKHLQITGVASEDGDKAFDEEEFAESRLPGVQVISV